VAFFGILQGGFFLRKKPLRICGFALCQLENRVSLLYWQTKLVRTLAFANDVGSEPAVIKMLKYAGAVSAAVPGAVQVTGLPPDAAAVQESGSALMLPGARLSALEVPSATTRSDVPPAPNTVTEKFEAVQLCGSGKAIVSRLDPVSSTAELNPLGAAMSS
jgi:hypothetical protein